MVDRKFEPIVRRKITEYLGDEDEDLIMFVVEHLKDKKGPQKLFDEIESVRHQFLSLCPHCLFYCIIVAIYTITIILNISTPIGSYGGCKRNCKRYMAPNNFRKRCVWGRFRQWEDVGRLR